MKIAIIGAGALGSLFGGLLSSVADVYLYTTNTAHIKAVQEKGLLISQQGRQDITVRPKAVCETKDIGKADAVFFFCKHASLRQAVQAALPCIAEDTVVITLQNGIGNGEIIGQNVPESQIYYGTTLCTSLMKESGQIEITSDNNMDSFFWPMDGVVQEKASAVAELMKRVGLNSEITPEVIEKIWRKLLITCTVAPLCAILRTNIGQLFHTPSSYELIKQAVFEITDVARAKGIALSREQGLRFVENACKSAPAHLPSLTQDVKNKRITEIGCLNVAVAAEGARLGVPTVIIGAIANMVLAIEANYHHAAF